MKNKLTLDDEGKVKLPIETEITQKYGFIGRTGSGKTHGAAVLAEDMLENGQQVIIIDPLDVWWGLKTSINGKHAGYEVVVFGRQDEKHTDLPLGHDAGELIAKTLVKHRVSAILSLAHLSNNKARYFVATFLETLYSEQQKVKRPVHIIVDEADEFAPQRVGKGVEAQSLGMMDRVVRRGRARGIGTTLITQRPAKLNKDVLTQVECMFTLQLTGPHDKKAMLEWVDKNGEPEQAKLYMESLAALQPGHAWLWSPSWLRVFKQIHIRQKRTFDSSKTPEVNSKLVLPKASAKTDLAAIKSAFAKTLEEAERNDPRALQRKLDTALKEVNALRSKPAIVAGMTPAQVKKEVEKAVKDINERWRTAVRHTKDRIIHELDQLAKTTFDEPSVTVPAVQPAEPIKPQENRVRPSVSTPNLRPLSAATSITEGLNAYALDLLEALGSTGGNSMSRAKLALAAKKSPKSSALDAAIAKLRGLELVSGDRSELCITEKGVHALGPAFVPIPADPAAKQAYWLQHGRLKPCPRTLLSVLLDHCSDGSTMTKEMLSEKSSYSLTSSAFTTALGVLRSNTLIKYEKDGLTVHENLL
jgi:hypothetical protein